MSVTNFSGDLPGAIQFVADQISALNGRVFELENRLAAHKNVLGTIMPAILLNRGLLEPGQWAEILDACADDVQAALPPTLSEDGRAQADQILAAIKELGAHDAPAAPSLKLILGGKARDENQ